MLFNSIDFILFLPAIVILYYLVPAKSRWILLLAGSYYFYMCWKWQFIFLIIFSTLVDYWAGLKMTALPDKVSRKKFLYLSLICNLGLLFFYKYFNFFSENTEQVLRDFNLFYNFRYFDILLPVGISFYTFQTLSYTIDVYQGRTKAETHLGYFALYVAYFPQLVAGPIERSERLIPQLRRNSYADEEDVKYAVNKIALGFFKKLVVADTLAVYINLIFGNVNGSTGVQLYIAAFFFGVQLFCDFSGYTDIAMGSARLMGVNLMENFKRPYWSLNLSEYWSRWHISLTSWIRDYLYIPLTEKNRNPLYLAFASILVMVAIGVWHGAAWTFIMFGLVNGIILLAQRIIRNVPIFAYMREIAVGKFLLRMWTMHIMLFCGIYFRSVDIAMAHTIFRKIFTSFNYKATQILALYKYEFVISVTVCLLLMITLMFNERLKFRYNWLYLSGVIVLVLLLGQDTKNQFIYFQF